MAALADWTDPEVDTGELLVEVLPVDRGGSFGHGPRRGGTEQAPSHLELGLDVGRGEQPIVADFPEPSWEQMVEESADELEWRHGRRCAISGGDRDAVVGDRENPVVGDRDAVGVATEVGVHLLGTGKGALGVHAPFLGEELPAQALEALWRGVVGQLEEPVAVGLGQRRVDLAAKEAAKDLDREQVLVAGSDPALAVGREAPASDDAVQVGVESQITGPGVQDSSEPDLGAEPSRVLGESVQGC